MFKLGITGGIGSGKSTASKFFKKKGLINCISYNSPNILRKKRPSISIAIIKVSMDSTIGPTITYYGSTGEGNCISAASLVTEVIDDSIIPVVKESSSPVNQLYLVDLDNNQCGRIKVNDILIKIELYTLNNGKSNNAKINNIYFIGISFSLGFFVLIECMLVIIPLNIGFISFIIDQNPPISIAPTPKNLILVFHICHEASTILPSVG